MTCSSCSRRTLSLFVRSFVNAELPTASRTIPFRTRHASQFSSIARRSQTVQRDLQPPSEDSHHVDSEPMFSDIHPVQSPIKKNISQAKAIKPKKKERWQAEKAATQEKLGGEAWNPRKRLSPDTMEGIRHLHHTQPQRFTTAVLAEQFKVSPDAIRRILKSKWRPSEEEQENRAKRWDKRGERIWSNLVELGVKPPKRWREMGVGRASAGKRPRWKSNHRNTVPVNDSAKDDDEFRGDIIPTVDGKSGERISVWQDHSMSGRLL